MAKPRVKLHSFRLLCQIDSFIRRYDVKGNKLPTVASGVLDGAVSRHEVDELIRKGLLRIVRDGNGHGDPGEGYTLYLTEKAMGAFWPRRWWC
jgi:hypothetical protein